MKNILRSILTLLLSSLSMLNIPIYADQINTETIKLAALEDEVTAKDVFAYLWDQKVVTVSRREQKISEAPASITVITSDDIKRSGALNIYDLLRPVVGMDVVGLSQIRPTVSMRGFNSFLLTRTLLVLLDGNPMYTEVDMATPWQALPISLEEIERIEIVRGPGSALWGANAYAGIINIITKSPGKFPDLQVNGHIGDLGTIYTNVVHARKLDKLQYRLQYSHDQCMNVTINPNDLAVKRNTYKFDMKYVLPRQHELSVQYGYAALPVSVGLNPAFNMLETKVSKQFTNVAYKAGETWIKLRQNLGKLHVIRQGSPYVPAEPTPYNDKSIGVEAQTTKKFQRFGVVTYGAEYKFVDASFMGPRRKQELGSLFANDDIKLNRKLSLAAGVRADTHPQIRTVFSPRLSLMYTPATNHTFRITGANAFRLPGYIDLYANSLLNIPGLPAPVPILGNENIKPERIRSIELNYTTEMTKRIKVSATIFRNILDNFLTQLVTPAGFTFTNAKKATQNGAELELESVISQNVKGFINYAFNQTKNTKTGGPWEMSPKHKANAGLGWMPDSGPYGNLVFNFVDDTGQTIVGKFKRVEPYRNVDVNLGYRFDKALEGLELALGAHNVFNKKRKEHPAGDTLKRRVVGTINYSF